MRLQDLRDDFEKLRDPIIGKKRIKDKLKSGEKDLASYLSLWLALSKEAEHVYPSQGLLFTPYDYLKYSSLQMLPQETIVKTLRLRAFFLEMLNHPYRIKFLKKVDSQSFKPVPKVKSKAIDSAGSQGLSVSIGDLGASVAGSVKERLGRTQRYAEGPFVKLGRQARSPFVGSESPDVWNSAAAIATMAASHCLCAIPRNGVMSDLTRQAEFAKETFKWLEAIEADVLQGRGDRASVTRFWRNNVMGAIEGSPEKALIRADSLYSVGVRAFRVYSPEPGTGPVETVRAIRKEFGKEVEIFTGQIVDISQAKAAEAAGADGIVIGIGGGGRCVTGVRSGSVIDWPELLWQLRGNIKIPVVVQGGASDHVATTLLLGASGIGVSRAVSGGTLESPGGALYCANSGGKLFKPYGGEASARTKYLDGKLLPFNVPSFVEGETTEAQMSYVKFVYPTLTYNLHLLMEDAILAMVFRNCKNIHELHTLNPSPLRRITPEGSFQRGTH